MNQNRLEILEKSVSLHESCQIGLRLILEHFNNQRKFYGVSKENTGLAILAQQWHCL